MKYCLDCGKEISPKAIRCNKCAVKCRLIKRGLKFRIQYSGFCFDCGKEINVFNRRCHDCALKNFQRSIGHNTKEITYCLDCGKLIDWRSKRCVSCALKENWKNEEYRLKMSDGVKRVGNFHSKNELIFQRKISRKLRILHGIFLVHLTKS